MAGNTCLFFLLGVTCLAVTAAGPAGYWATYRLDRNDVDDYFADVLSREFEQLSQVEMELKGMFHDCELKINNTYDACLGCTEAKCSAPPQEITDDKPSFLQKAMAILENPDHLLNGPLKAVEKVAEKLTKKAGDIIKNGLKKAANWLSDDAKDAVKKVVSKIGRGIGGAAKKIGKGTVKLFKKTFSGVAKLGKRLFRGVSRTARKIASGVKSAVKSIGRGVSHVARKAWGGAKSAVRSVGRGVSHVARKAWGGAKSAVRSIGRGVSHVARKAWGGIKSFFGRRRRRRSITQEEKNCYAKCPSCSGVILEDPTAKIRAVCGEAVIQKNTTLARKMQSVTSLSNTLEMGDIIQVKYYSKGVDEAGFSTQTQVIGNIEGEVFKYNTKLPIHVGDGNTPNHITNILQEFERKWTDRLFKKYNL